MDAVTKKDLQESEDRLEKKISKVIKDAFADFYESVVLPNIERSDREHEKTRVEVRSIRDELVDYVKDHEVRIRKIEKIITTS